MSRSVARTGDRARMTGFSETDGEHRFDARDSGACRRVGRGESCFPTDGSHAAAERDHLAERVGERLPVSHAHRAAVGLELGATADGVRQRVRHVQRSEEHPRDSGQDRRHDSTEGGQRGRVRHERLGRGAGDVLEEEADPCEQQHGQRQPVPERQRRGVESEVMAELVREHARQLRIVSSLIANDVTTTR